MNSEGKFPVLLFDGVCNLCNAWVQWVLKRDKAGVFRFAALQSDTGQRLLAHFGREQDSFDTVILIVDNQVFTHSDVALEVFRRLGKPWAWLYWLRVVPAPLRNAIYNAIARNRYRLFGQKDECWLPRPEWKERFL